MTTASDRDAQLARLARGWDEAVDGYDAYYVPRFAPWVADAVAEVTAGALPDGPVLVPCCGTFPEFAALAARLPDREIVGIDLSAGMVRRASERTAGHPRARVVRGDASTLDPAWSGRCAAVVSVFGLQQLPEPETALASWAAALRPGGRLCVVYWPVVTETSGPFALLAEVVRAGDSPAAPAPDRTWEDRLVPALAGLTVVRDAYPSHPMTHPDPLTLFDAYAYGGPLRALALARGEAYVDRLRADFLERAPSGQLHHRPRARLLSAVNPSAVRS